MADAIPTPPPLPAPPRKPTGKLIAVLIAVGIGIAGAFNVDVCGTLGSLGVHLDACALSLQPASVPTP